MAQKSLSNNRLNDVPLPIHYENIVFKIQNNLTVLINTRASISVLYFKSSKFFRGDCEKALVLRNLKGARQLKVTRTSIYLFWENLLIVRIHCKIFNYKISGHLNES